MTRSRLPLASPPRSLGLLLLLGGPPALSAPAQQVVLIEDVTNIGQAPDRLPPLQPSSWLRGKAFSFGTEDAPRLTLLVRANDRFVLHTDSSLLDDLQRRYRDGGLAVVGVVGRRPGDEPLQRWPADLGLVESRALARTLQGGGATDPVVLADREGTPLWYGPVDAGIGWWIRAALDGEPVPAVASQHLAWRLENLGEIEDHDDKQLQNLANAMIQANPTNPDGWILRLILAVERQVDPEAARQVAAEAYAKMGMDPAALSRFTEKLLRTEAHDQKLLQQAFVAMVPVAAMADNDLPLQLTYLKVLNALGRAKEAERVALRLLELTDERPELRAPLAEAMAFGAQPRLFAENARKLIEAAVLADPLEEELRYVQYMVLLRCCGDEAAANAALQPALDRSGSLNNTAWYMMTMDRSGRGRFGPVALAFCKRMQATETISYTEEDTIALSYCVNGLLEEAVEMQEKACSATSDPAYRRRLERYRKALEQRQESGR